MDNKITLKIIKSSSVDEELLNSLYEIEKNSGGDPYGKTEFAEMIGYVNNIHLVAYIDKIAVGILTMNPNSKKFGGCIYLINISVMEEYHRQGIATRLIKECIRYIVSSYSGDSIFALEVDKENEKAIELYKKFGMDKNNEYSSDSQYCMMVRVKDLKDRRNMIFSYQEEDENAVSF